MPPCPCRRAHTPHDALVDKDPPPPTLTCSPHFSLTCSPAPSLSLCSCRHGRALAGVAAELPPLGSPQSRSKRGIFSAVTSSPSTPRESPRETLVRRHHPRLRFTVRRRRARLPPPSDLPTPRRRAPRAPGEPMLLVPLSSLSLLLWLLSLRRAHARRRRGHRRARAGHGTNTPRRYYRPFSRKYRPRVVPVPKPSVTFRK